MKDLSETVHNELKAVLRCVCVQCVIDCKGTVSGKASFNYVCPRCGRVVVIYLEPKEILFTPQKRSHKMWLLFY